MELSSIESPKFPISFEERSQDLDLFFSLFIFFFLKEARRASSEKGVDKKVLEADAYLQILIEQVKALEQKMEGEDGDNIRETLDSMRNNAKVSS